MGNFENIWPSPSKIIVSICRKFSCLSAYKSLTSLLEYCKEIEKLFWVIWIGLATHTPKMIVFIWRILWCLSASKKWTSSPTFFWRYCKDMQTCYSAYFGQAWLRTRKFNAYLHVKFKLHNSLLSWDINFARYGIGGKISMIISVFIQNFLGEKIK